MAEVGYNGWSNRATWNANLWLTNDERLYRQVCRLDAITLRVSELALAIETLCGEEWPSGKTPDNDSLADVNWREIAEAWEGLRGED